MLTLYNIFSLYLIRICILYESEKHNGMTNVKLKFKKKLNSTPRPLYPPGEAPVHTEQ
jgi:hypothetical protein